MRNFQNLLIISGLQYNRELVSSFPKWSIPEIWNSFEAVDIKVETSRSLFNKKLKKHLLNELTIECNHQNCQECS